MLAKNAYLIMTVMFLLFGRYSYQNNNFITVVFLIWASIVFLFFWSLHFLNRIILFYVIGVLLQLIHLKKT